MVSLEDFNRAAATGFIAFDSEEMMVCHTGAQEAMKITTELNSRYHTPEEVVDIFRKLTGRDVPDSFRCFPPFYTDFGKNIHLGEHVFINAGCKFQDQGGLFIGRGTHIGHNVVIATLNHREDPKHRADLLPAPVVIGEDCWIGSNSTILPGVTIGDGAIVGAGAVVTKDIPAGMVAAGVPARVIRKIKLDHDA